MKKHDDNSNVIREYNTTIASLPVLEGLETGETVIQQNPDIIEMLLTSSEPLVGTTQTITPSQVLATIKVGRDIALQYTDSYYGAFVFSAFNANERLGIVVSNSIIPQMDGLTGTLLGFVEDDTWLFKATKTATKDDVGTAVNEALTAAKASGEFDGADGITPTIGDNGNWFLGDVDTNKPSRGTNGKSAYSYAQEGGYTGTEAEFAAKLAAKKLPNPYPLTFTGAVNETYDGSSAKTIEIPSGGGSSGSYFGVYTVEEDVSQYRIPFEVSRYRRIVISVNQPSSPASLTIGFSIDGFGGSTAKEGGMSSRTCFMFDIIEWTPGILANGGKYEIFGYSRRNNNPGASTLLNAVVQYVTTEENSLIISGNDGAVISQGSIITITAIP